MFCGCSNLISNFYVKINIFTSAEKEARAMIAALQESG
jgi:hypothetical protein